MYKFTVEAYDESDLGKLNIVHITVYAETEDAAIERAKTIRQRTTYSVTGIEELAGDSRPQIKKG